jgi:hypothetical protein
MVLSVLFLSFTRSSAVPMMSESGYGEQEAFGVVERIAWEPTTSGGVQYTVWMRWLPFFFTGGSELSPKLTLTQPGDSVRIGYIASEQDVVTT